MKLIYLFKEMIRLIRRHKAYVLAPSLAMLLLLTLMAFYVGPGAVLTFIYSGV